MEGLAGHRGSLLGNTGQPQPSQKAFESELAAALCGFDPDRLVLVEAESNKIGARIIPPSLWDAMKPAGRIRLDVPIDVRARYLVRAYDDVLSDGARLKSLLNHLRAYRGHAIVDHWFQQIDSDDKLGLTRSLMEQHYDPSYDASRRSVNAPVVAVLGSDNLDPSGIDELAERIENHVAQLSESVTLPA